MVGVDETDRTDKAIGPDPNRRGGSRIATQDRTGDQRLLVPIAPTLTPGDESDDAGECSGLFLLGDVHSPSR